MLLCMYVAGISAFACSRRPVCPETEQTGRTHTEYLSNALVYTGNLVLAAGDSYDFHSGALYSAAQYEALDYEARQFVDCKLETSGDGLRFSNAAEKKYKTRYRVLDCDAAAFGAISSRTALAAALDGTVWDNTGAPMVSPQISGTPVYMAFKTYTETEGNCYGILEIKKTDGNSVTLDCRFALEASIPDYTGARKVEIRRGRMYVDGVEFYVKGAAATMEHTAMAAFGANTCRVYSLGSAGLLDRLYEAGLMCYAGLGAPSYKSLAGSPDYDDADFREEMIRLSLEKVRKFKDHPALLCWSLGNEAESGGKNREGLFIYYGALASAIKELDPYHPVTITMTEVPEKWEADFINSHCGDVDFVSYNTYYSFLNDHRDFRAFLAGIGMTKPYMITEYGPTGTWNRKHEDLSDRINDWGALIQLSSEEAALRYIDCYNLISAFDNCLGGIAFWWGYQTHGEVLGWYPFYTKDLHMLPAVHALESCWKDIPYDSKAPRIQSWKYSVELNGMNADAPQWASSGKACKNPVLSPGQSCRASVIASCRSGNPSASLRYKWFIYSDASYSLDSYGWKRIEDGEYVYDTHGMHMAMDEDARAELFEDRTRAEVSFAAPSRTGNYRLYVMAYDDSNYTAATACINFKVGQ